MNGKSEEAAIRDAQVRHERYGEPAQERAPPWLVVVALTVPAFAAGVIFGWLMN